MDTDETFLCPSCLVGRQQCFVCKAEGTSDTASPGPDVNNVRNACLAPLTALSQCILMQLCLHLTRCSMDGCVRIQSLAIHRRFISFAACAWPQQKVRERLQLVSAAMLPNSVYSLGRACLHAAFLAGTLYALV